MFEYASFAIRNLPYVTKNARKQPEVRKAMLAYARGHRVCEATGKTKNLHVHHIVPVSISPGLAGNPSNFMMLERKAHLQDGHGGNWKNYVLNIRDVIKVRRVVKTGAFRK